MKCTFSDVLILILVLLAPYGLNAHLTGYSLSDGDVRAVKILEEWKKFFPINGGSTKFQFGQSKSDCCSSVVEVMLGEVKMMYPACLVLLPVTHKEGLRSYVFL